MSSRCKATHFYAGGLKIRSGKATYKGRFVVTPEAFNRRRATAAAAMHTNDRAAFTALDESEQGRILGIINVTELEDGAAIVLQSPTGIAFRAKVDKKGLSGRRGRAQYGDPRSLTAVRKDVTDRELRVGAAIVSLESLAGAPKESASYNQKVIGTLLNEATGGELVRALDKTGEAAGYSSKHRVLSPEIVAARLAEEPERWNEFEEEFYRARGGWDFRVGVEIARHRAGHISASEAAFHALSRSAVNAKESNQAPYRHPDDVTLVNAVDLERLIKVADEISTQLPDGDHLRKKFHEDLSDVTDG